MWVLDLDLDRAKVEEESRAFIKKKLKEDKVPPSTPS